MPDAVLTPAAAATLAAQAVAVPALTVFGMHLGLRADILLAGFCGSVAAMALLNSVPATGDTVRELLRTSVRRTFTAMGSAVTAGYTSPLVALLANVPDALLVGIAFVVGAGAQQVLPRLIFRVAPAKPPEEGPKP